MLEQGAFCVNDRTQDGNARTLKMIYIELKMLGHDWVILNKNPRTLIEGFYIGTPAR